MKLRAGPERLFPNDRNLPREAHFSVNSCEARPASGATSASLGSLRLPLPPSEINRIVILGDTGCRIKGKKKTQNCNDPSAWPYETLVGLAADAKPDLVIHVGDYLYREKSCTGGPDCPQSDTGYGWQVWKEDFFDPSKRLFAAAPWIMVRGNHETCHRAGEGWFRFLDAFAVTDGECPVIAESLAVRLGNMGFVVLDSAQVADASEAAGGGDDDDDDDGSAASPAAHLTLPQALRQKFEAIRSDVPPNPWILTHAPFNGIRVGKGSGESEVDNTVLQDALGGLLPPDVAMIVSGHIHLFEALTFTDGRPPQLVAGTGGDKLGKMPKHVGQFDQLPLAERPVILKEFGYMLWTRNGSDASNWTGELFDQSGSRLIHCQLTARQLSCGTD